MVAIARPMSLNYMHSINEIGTVNGYHDKSVDIWYTDILDFLPKLAIVQLTSTAASSPTYCGKFNGH